MNAVTGTAALGRAGPNLGSSQLLHLSVQVEIQGPLLVVSGSRTSLYGLDGETDGEVWVYEWDPELYQYATQSALVADESPGHCGGFGQSLSLDYVSSGPTGKWRLAVGAPKFDDCAGRVYLYERYLLLPDSPRFELLNGRSRRKPLNPDDAHAVWLCHSLIPSALMRRLEGNNWRKLFQINGNSLFLSAAPSLRFGISVCFQNGMLVAVAAETCVYKFSFAAGAAGFKIDSPGTSGGSATAAFQNPNPIKGPGKESSGEDSRFSLVSSQKLVRPDDPVLNSKSCEVTAQNGGLLLLWNSLSGVHVYGASDDDDRNWTEQSFVDQDALPNDLPSSSRVRLVYETLFAGWSQGKGAKLLAISMTE